MQRNHLQNLAQSIKESRIKKRYTQRDLAEISGISLRSIQRIENAEVLPRSHTLRVLADHLDFSLEPQPSSREIVRGQLNNAQKIILSFSVAMLLFLLAGAYIFQSTRFPETELELVLYIAGFIGIYVIIILVVWK
ncbi:helix-turn-helix domain-containing protein [Parapedobacter sp. GCM10030251]|uniref:helix-turn-helix domain-containing protein n=1 Tax=Parapedobacter sp. GCM10030251 TaxID=3273419 RepID=UPI00360CEB99